jgi:hypothetical protein
MQLFLLVKAIGYWCFGLLVLSGPIVLFEAHPGLLNDQGAWSLTRPVIITAVVVLPIVLYSVLNQSTRFIGPMLRLQQSMRQLKAGEQVAPLVFRKRDFWHDFAEDFNALAARVEQLEREQSADAQADLVEETCAAGDASGVWRVG